MKLLAERKHRIILHGALKKFGPIYDIFASSPAQVIRALILQIPQFAKELEEGSYRVVLGENVRKGFSYEECDFGERGSFLWDLGKDSTLHLIPQLRGKKSGGGWGKAVIGAIILTSALVLAPPAGWVAGPTALAAGGAEATTWSLAGGGMSATAFSVLGADITYGSIAVFGAALMFAGVSTLMGYNQKSNYADRESPDQRASFFFNGPVNTSEQGSVIPLVYGKCRTGSVVASAGLTVEQI